MRTLRFSDIINKIKAILSEWGAAAAAARNNTSTLKSNNYE